MPMIPFVKTFPELGVRETRSVKVNGTPDLPDGEYGFIESYCNERGCDCRRVIISVIRPETGWSRVLATIGYGWESLEFYQEWSRGPVDPKEVGIPYLDVLNPQSEYSSALLGIFEFLLESPDYVERIKRHYRMFRDAVEKEHGRPAAFETNRAENRRKRLRDPRRRGRRSH